MTNSLHTPRVVELARKIEQDIAARELQPGDAYLNAAAVAQMLRVSTMAANQAMQLLVQRRVLQRRQRSGTFIAQPEASPMNRPIDSLLLVVHQSYLKTEGILADGVVVGISQYLPGVNVRFAFTPVIDDQAFIEKTVQQCMASDETTGLVLVRSSLAVQRVVAASALPAVVYGTPQPSITSLPWIDRDQFEIGRLLARRVLGRGHRRLILLMRDRMLPGDHPFQDGVRTVANEFSLTVDAVVYRDLPPDGRAISAEMRRLLRQGPPPGIVARSETLANGAIEAIEAQGLSLGDDVSLAIADVYRRGNENPPRCPYIRTLLGPREQGEAIGRLLVDAIEHRIDHVRIPVELIEGAADGKNERN